MKNLLSLFVLATLLFSCGKDDDTGLSSEEASTKILAAGELAAADIMTMTESEGVQALSEFSTLFTDLDQFSNAARKEQQSWVKNKLRIISQYFVEGPGGRASGSEEFVFDNIKGVYNYNPETGEFDLAEASEFFIVNFPSEGSTTNNAQLKITNLQIKTVTYTEEGWTYEEEYPTVIEGSLAVDGETFVTLTATASWSDDGAPLTADIDLFVAPFTFTLDFDDTNATSLSGSASLSKEGTTLMAVDLTVDFQTAFKEEISNVSGFVQYSNLKVSGSLNVAGIEANEASTSFDINDYVDLDILIDDQKVGDVVFEEDIAYIVYLDGTKENLELLLEEVIADIEAAIGSLEEEEPVF